MAKLKTVQEKFQIAQEAAEFNLTSFDLQERMTDEQIESELPENHLFETKDVYRIIGSLMADQANGEEGVLLSNGYTNLFYTKAFVVLVRWRGDVWFVVVWDRDGGEWDAGFRVFSPLLQP